MSSEYLRDNLSDNENITDIIYIKYEIIGTIIYIIPLNGTDISYIFQITYPVNHFKQIFKILKFGKY